MIRLQVMLLECCCRDGVSGLYLTRVIPVLLFIERRTETWHVNPTTQRVELAG